ncbi:aminoglycoside 6'-N-acetyltransferase [Xanthomonas translucens]|uniref:Aminoglycoside N(6')-acetyltransferase type 1 n=3 Tax=Xanthomonas campestris pv. translucens TaxID=343 RepID=A0A120EVR3_XANCT|nr:aminoglycoside 6'-N-acetyltransferase [Xanthomonas translucens]KTF36691.1 aminoglycoside 6'-acetyltransferase [Xanthomonas translucens pv. translucens]KWV11689.1 aminoglycoside 6'-acetyltransferase [Xanthomonas translucens]KWV11922.1 aminoglycoside 6'-acetyltransferase [Xanthomonas translucens]MCC8448661.1 GNAT family N-acetyltransferase [Xanthomonas translucens pv. translucens]MCS3358607.1 GNAT family N-acetyltransferase [Xanthomonas translucens pv. translucens]
MTEGFSIRAAAAADLRAWAALRMALWPDERDAFGGVAEALQREDAANFLAFAGAGYAIGFADVTLRQDYVNGTDSSPVGFLEGWYVVPEWRGRGVGRALLRQVQDWTCAQGCSELASDALLDDAAAQAAHRACGFEESERVVYFRMSVAD